ncbi:MAG TPA: hypothetical protein PKY59_01435, partial [Pyrinomonadaceae bacterium]|nr:hypothetical protein [Pyrinomonadaceae bacterium]
GKNSYQNAGSGYLRNALIFLLFGIIFLVFGATNYSSSSNSSLFTITVGVCFILGAVLFFSMAQKYKGK